MDISKLPDGMFSTYEHLDTSDTGRFPQFDTDFYKNGYPEQEIRNKIPRIYAWGCCSSTVDYDKKSFKYVIMVNADETREVVVSYKEICELMQWKSFKFSKDGLRVIPEQAA